MDMMFYLIETSCLTATVSFYIHSYAYEFEL